MLLLSFYACLSCEFVGVIYIHVYHVIYVCPPTVKSFVELGRYLLNYPGVKFLLSERFTQDPLESFFGHQRQKGGGSDNPNVLQFTYTTSSIRAQKAITPAIRGNVRGSKHSRGDEGVCDAPLPKRPRKVKHT